MKKSVRDISSSFDRSPRKSSAPPGVAGAFAPKSRTSLFVRNRLGLFSIGWIADPSAGGRRLSS
jgi:hypothetical protein